MYTETAADISRDLGFSPCVPAAALEGRVGRDDDMERLAHRIPLSARANL